MILGSRVSKSTKISFSVRTSDNYTSKHHLNTRLTCWPLNDEVFGVIDLPLEYGTVAETVSGMPLKSDQVRADVFAFWRP